MSLVEVDPRFRRKLVLTTPFLGACLLILWLLGTQPDIWESQPIVRYPLLVVGAGFLLVCLVVDIWLIRSRGGVLVRATETGLVVLPPIWSLRREVIRVRDSERAHTSIEVRDTKSGALVDFDHTLSAGPWTLVIDTPSRLLRVNLRGLQVKRGYMAKVQMWREAC